jgi:hypothetical protein
VPSTQARFHASAARMEESREQQRGWWWTLTRRCPSDRIMTRRLRWRDGGICFKVLICGGGDSNKCSGGCKALYWMWFWFVEAAAAAEEDSGGGG